MNPVVKQKWLDALRSGEYVQGQHVLTEVPKEGPMKHCCLGVLCQIALDEKVIGPPSVYECPLWQVGQVEHFAEGSQRRLLYGESKSSAVLPDEVVQWAGLDSENPNIGEDGQVEIDDTFYYASELSRMNDDGVTFDKIADVIEEYL